MQALVDAQYVVENRDTYMLQYLLTQPGMLSTTGYKVLQGQEAAGLIPCYRVIYDTMDKLDYDVERYQDLASMLPALSPNLFLHYINGIFSVLLNMRNIGFLHPHNLEITLDKIFVDAENHKVYMVYLPLVENLLAAANAQYEQTLKAGLLYAIDNYPNLHSEMTSAVYALLANPTSTWEQIQALLSNLEPLPQPQVAAAPAAGTSTLYTGRISNSGGLSQELGTQSEAPLVSQTAPEAAPAADSEPVKKASKKGLFGGKKTSPNVNADADANAGGTEVLSLFIPSIYLKGQGKSEFLIDKQEYTLGRDSAADGTIDSTAISRKHCKITFSDDRNFLTDLGSSNGTYLNGTRLEANKPRPINEGDKLKLGNVSFTVMNV